MIFHSQGYGASQMLRKKSYVARLKELMSSDRVYFIYCLENVENKLRQVGVVNPRSYVLYYGIDNTRFAFQPNVEQSTFRFIHVSNLQEKNGLKYSLMAFKVFIKDKVNIASEFVVVGGSGDALNEMKAIAQQLEIASYDIFLGQLSAEDVANEL